jgi:hypothetical protein
VTTWHVILICTIVAIVVGVPLQFLWTRELHRRHGDRYSFSFIRRKLGRSPFGRFVLQPGEELDPAFRRDLERMQRRVSLCNVAMLAACFLAILVWVLLSKQSGP